MKQRKEGANYVPADDKEDLIVEESRVKSEGKLILLYAGGKKVVIDARQRSVKAFLTNGHILARYRNGDLKRVSW